jgi:predicted small secreted protein
MFKRLLIIVAVAGAAWVAGKVLEDADKNLKDPDRAAYEARFQKTTCDIQDLGEAVADSAETATQA